jgi:SHS2 domain-containing protein
MYKEIDHTADYAIRAWGADLPELFVEAARGMNALAGGELGQADQPGRIRELSLEAQDLESLLVLWLEELTLLMELEGEQADGFEIQALTTTSLQAKVTTRKVVGLNKLIKAVTYHDLSIRPSDGGYGTVIVFDV